MQIIEVEIASLKVYEKNARIHSKKQIERIAKSIKQFGFTNPVLIDGTGLVLAGHGRLEALKLLSETKVKTICIDYLTPTQAQAYILADNRIAELSEWDKDLLSSELKDLLSLNFDLNLIGFENFDFGERKEFDNEQLKENKLLLLIECISELELQNLFEEIKNRGFKCKLID